jgi:hypothetical protein
LGDWEAGGEGKIRRAIMNRWLLVIMIGMTLSMNSFSYSQAYKPEVPTVIKCNFIKTAYFMTRGETLDFKVKDKEEQFTFIISGLNTDTPTIKSSDGWESPLTILRRNKNSIYLVELTHYGYVNYIALLLDQKVVTFVKSYPSSANVSMCFMSFGYFE